MRDENSIDYESGSLETIKKLVEIEGGYTLLPELSINDNVLNNKHAQVKSISDSDPLREVSMVYSRNFAMQHLLQILFECIRKSVPRHLLNKNHGHIVEWRK